MPSAPETMQAWRVHELGDPLDVLRLDRVPTLEPTDGHVVLEVLAAAVNFADTLLCRGTYQEKPELPFTPGLELCGRVLSAPSGAPVCPASGSSPCQRSPTVGWPSRPWRGPPTCSRCPTPWTT